MSQVQWRSTERTFGAPAGSRRCHSNPMFSWIVRIALETGMRLFKIGGLRMS
ncbi:hypothetical protein L499_A2315 [Bordetella holmesii CDC-H635-BH]|uniref:Uncharacterized protein n=1 Tax=Bordetella holmesii CDC-H585-BH TaxID=1331206 RepID=A0A158M4I5_9BORD|nr:hypothetical protein D560_0629 [Bordetella holmesii ATCC 51541]EWM45870.1 hypothetical protein D557_3880 [Bordetella holmesii 70147]KAK80499.1 hypothetical protein L503_2318 [Bordetella holmesii CDC-H809-BH]KAK86361.1 hypothetical protein L573_0342 [Bordetella holmesii H620]KAK87511.1 hypothetical protein L496_2277 [Bordetella holmesii CDC-H572-BH]KAK89772.1 hypothetical protein L497_2306 [Bordetella holmesii CDC-H585-BH]KAK99396.1 hypothetical protein L499_A2315 [Bordetella holmesii CDC-H